MLQRRTLPLRYNRWHHHGCLQAGNAVTTDVKENRELVETKTSWQAGGSPVGLMFMCSAVVSCSHIVSWFPRYWDFEPDQNQSYELYLWAFSPFFFFFSENLSLVCLWQTSRNWKCCIFGTFMFNIKWNSLFIMHQISKRKQNNDKNWHFNNNQCDRNWWKGQIALKGDINLLVLRVFCLPHVLFAKRVRVL